MNDIERIAAIEGRVKNATPPPWAVEASGDTDFGYYVCAAYPDDHRSASNDNIIGAMETHEDALAVVYAMEDIPYLLSALRTAQELVEAQKKLLGVVTTQRDLNEGHGRDLKHENGKLRKRVQLLEEKLRWCGGSQDFSLEGQAWEGWKKLVAETNLYGQNDRGK